MSPLASSDVIWYRRRTLFLPLDAAEAARFYPAPDEPLVEQLNSAMRFAVYFSVVLAVLRREPAALILAAVVGLGTYAVYESQQKGVAQEAAIMERLKVEERYRGRRVKPGTPTGPLLKPTLCTQPTVDNPFMNPTLVDLAYFPNRPPACPIVEPDVARRVQKDFEHDLYRDVDDVFDRYVSSRQFYTVPVTTIPTDQTGFANWVYGSGPTCKEPGGAAQCVRNLGMTNGRDRNSGSGDVIGA